MRKKQSGRKDGWKKKGGGKKNAAPAHVTRTPTTGRVRVYGCATPMASGSADQLLPLAPIGVFFVVREREELLRRLRVGEKGERLACSEDGHVACGVWRVRGTACPGGVRRVAVLEMARSRSVTAVTATATAAAAILREERGRREEEKQQEKKPGCWSPPSQQRRPPGTPGR